MDRHHQCDSPAASYEALRMADLEDDLRLEQALPEELLLKLQDTRQKIHAVKTAMRKLKLTSPRMTGCTTCTVSTRPDL